MRKIFLLTLLLVLTGSMNAQNNVVFQSVGSNANTATGDNQYYINGISTREDVGGVEISRGERHSYDTYFLKFTNYNNFMVSVIYELEDTKLGRVTGNIILKAREMKQSSDYYMMPANFRVIARQMNTGYQPQNWGTAPQAVTAGMGAGRIGFVCVDELVTQLPEYASMCAKIERFTQSKQLELANLKKEFKSKCEAFEAGYGSWSETERQYKQREIEGLSNEVSVFTERASQELNRYIADEKSPLLFKIKNAVDAVGRANGYDVIVDVTLSGNVLYKGKGFYELDELVRKELCISR